MSELRINNITDRAGSSGPIIAGVSTVTSTSHMVMPSGPTEMRGGRGRGAFGGGRDNPTYYADMNFVEIATTGNGIEFGDLNGTRGDGAGFSSPTRAVCALGASSSDTTVDFVQIMTTGNAVDYGDLNQGTYEIGGNSNGHGGLG